LLNEVQKNEIPSWVWFCTNLRPHIILIPEISKKSLGRILDLQGPKQGDAKKKDMNTLFIIFEWKRHSLNSVQLYACIVTNLHWQHTVLAHN
jgi:hypothetical protein